MDLYAATSVSENAVVDCIKDIGKIYENSSAHSLESRAEVMSFRTLRIALTQPKPDWKPVL